MAIKAIEHQLKWIPVNERLPKPNEYVDMTIVYYLVQNEYGDMLVAYYDGCGWIQMYHGYIEDEVVAWMHLPEQYNMDGVKE